MNKLLLRREFWDLSFLFALVGCSAVVISESSKIPPSYFDQLGASFFPTLIAWIIIGLSTLLIVKTIKNLYVELYKNSSPLGEEDKTRIVQVMLISALSVLYVLGVSFKTIPYSLLTGVFITLAVLVLKEDQKQHIHWVGLAAFIGGGILEYLFTQVFVMDLPRF